jgi:hypothetical protein
MVGQSNFGGDRFAPAGQVQVLLPNGAQAQIRGPQLSGAPIAQAQFNLRAVKPFEPMIQQQPIPSAAQAGQMPRGANSIPVVVPRTPFGMGGYHVQPLGGAPPPPPPAPAPRPAAAPSQAVPAGQELHLIDVRAALAGGQEDVRTFELVFPSGTRILGAAERHAYAMSGGGEAHVIDVRGQAPDGRSYVAPCEAVFAPGARILGVSERA